MLVYIFLKHKLPNIPNHSTNHTGMMEMSTASYSALVTICDHWQNEVAIKVVKGEGPLAPQCLGCSQRLGWYFFHSIHQKDGNCPGLLFVVYDICLYIFSSPPP